MKSFVGHEILLFDYMRERSLPVYHESILFVRDVQSAIRDYMREKENTVLGTLEVDRLADEFIADLELRGRIVPFGNNTYLLKFENYRLPSTKAEAPAETDAAA
jgi:hypothetical protein